MMHDIILGQIADIRSGYIFRSGVAHAPDGSVRVVGMKDLRVDVGIEWQGVTRIQPKQDLTDYLLRNEDILFTVRGARFYGVCVSGVDEQSIASHHLFHIRVRDRDIVRPEFLAWLLNRAEAQRYYAEHAMGQTALRGLRRQDMMSMPLRLPALVKQDEIVQVVDCLRQEIELFETSIQNRRAMQEALAAEMHRL